MSAEPCPNCQGGWLCTPCQQEGLKRDRERALAIAGAARALRQHEIARVLAWFEFESDEFISAEEKAIHVVDKLPGSP